MGFPHSGHRPWLRRPSSENAQTTHGMSVGMTSPGLSASINGCLSDGAQLRAGDADPRHEELYEEVVNAVGQSGDGHTPRHCTEITENPRAATDGPVTVRINIGDIELFSALARLARESRGRLT